MSRKAPFPNPLALSSLDDLCHPSRNHRYARPVWRAGEVLAANGYLACRIHRGLWLETDFEPVPPEVPAAIMALPWRDDLPDEWRHLDDLRGDLYARAPIAPFTSAGRASPSPVWEIAGARARLSHLQLIARLPGCHLHLGRPSPVAPIHFRFAGGRGIIANEPVLHRAPPARRVWQAEVCPLDGAPLPRRQDRTPTPAQEARARAYFAARAEEEARVIIRED